MLEGALATVVVVGGGEGPGMVGWTDTGAHIGKAAAAA